MGPEIIAALAAVTAALITAGPAYLSARRTGAAASRAAAAEGEATREAVAALAARLDAHTTATERTRIETREDIQSLRRDMRDMRDWQVTHAVEHLSAGR